MKKKLEDLTRNLSKDLIKLAEDATRSIILDSFKLQRNSTIKILSNHDYDKQNYSPLALILSQGYVNTAKELGFEVDVLLTNSKEAIEPVSQEEIRFIQETKKDDLVIFAVNNKTGSYSKTLKQNKTASNLLKQNKARYGQHLRIGGIGLKNQEDISVYLNALSMNYSETQELGNKIKELLQKTNEVKIISSDNSELVYEGGFKEPEVFCGNFDGTNNNYGGNLPSGETFTELQNLEAVNGKALITAYGAQKEVKILEKPEIIEIKNGNLTTSTSQDLLKLQEYYKNNNEKEFLELFKKGHLIRELGFGTNHEIGKQKLLPNVIWLEKKPGFHTSIGLSHTFYYDEAIDSIAQRINKKPIGHTDVMIQTKYILFDNKKIFENNQYII